MGYFSPQNETLQAINRLPLLCRVPFLAVHLALASVDFVMEGIITTSERITEFCSKLPTIRK